MPGKLPIHLRPSGPALTIFLTIVLHGCANLEEQATEAVGDTLANRRDAQYQNLRQFPGKVVCGEVAETDRWGPTRDFQPFIVRDGEVIMRPSREDRAIYCNSDPKRSLEKLLQSGPIKNNADLRQIMLDMRMLNQALEQYRDDAKNLPTTEQGLKALIRRPKGKPEPIAYREEGYIDSIPNDPWGRPYVYWRTPLSAAVAARYKLYTLGKDGQKGGSGADADITLRELAYLEHVSNL